MAIEEHREITIVEGVECNETLDVVKSVPEFNGDASRYTSWRQAAITAHKLYERYIGSSKYYQAVAILRNKVIGKADSVLSSYNTVLNFYAILERLDFAYADKRSVFTLEQELSTLTQGSKTILDFYNEVEEKLGLITSKITMSHGGNVNLIGSLNMKYREDALRVFISGLRKPFCDILFSCRPSDMPTALILAQEMATNQSRYNFARNYNEGTNRQSAIGHPRQMANLNISANSFSNSAAQRTLPQSRPQQMTLLPNYRNTNVMHNNVRWQSPSNSHPIPYNNIRSQQNFPSDNRVQQQPLDNDVSMRTVGTTQHNSLAREAPGSSRQIRNNTQRVFHLSDNQQGGHAVDDGTFSEYPELDQINFLGMDPSCPMSRGNLKEEN